MTNQQPIMLAITGGIACGKSEAGRILEEQGFDVLDADLLAHSLMKSGSNVFQRIVDFFGTDILALDGEIDRPKLAQKVFGNEVALHKLNGLVHPAVIEAGEAWKRERSGNAAVLIPLLFEAGWINGWDAIICVSADEQTVFQRLEKRGISREEARVRIAAQMPLSEKKRQSDFCIENNETLEALKQKLQETIRQIRSRGQTHE
jgi:dephospho-CoA kinase